MAHIEYAALVARNMLLIAREDCLVKASLHHYKEVAKIQTTK